VAELTDRLGALEREFADIEAQLADPDVLADRRRYTDLARRHKELDRIVTCGRALKLRTDDLVAAREMAAEATGDDREMMQAEAAGAETDIARLTDELRLLLLPADPNEHRDVIVEIRGAEGGEEANLFARDLYEMYRSFAGRMGWKVEVLGAEESDLGGFATVTVLPEADEVEVDIDPNDLKVDVYRSSGPGGQSVNTTDSAVRITHLPTGVVVAMQDEKSQIQNRARAMVVLRSRLLKLEQDRQAAELSDARRGQVGGGGRSEKIRTYNFKENRVSDHRIGLTIYKLDKVLAGELDEVSDALVLDEQTRRLLGETEPGA
jgi:peptide chain release factor 1